MVEFNVCDYNVLFLSFYPNLFFENFHICFEYPSQLRYSIAFPLICSHFMSCTHELCPEEVIEIEINMIYLIQQNIYIFKTNKNKNQEAIYWTKKYRFCVQSN